MSAARTVGAVDDSAAGPARMTGASLGGFIDESTLTEEIRTRNPNYGPHNPHPIQQYIKRVIEKSGVPMARATMEMASNICGEIARLPFVPDDKEKLDDGKTEYEQQVVKTAKRAEESLDSPQVWTSSARKLAQAALDLRKQDPDGKKKLAWVNDPMPGEVAD